MATGDKAGETMPTTLSSAGHNELSDTENVQLKDDGDNIVTIPAGFHVAAGSPTKQEDGIVVEDEDKNQFIWIPVADISDYKRTDLGFDNGGYTVYSETMPSDEQTSVNKYHGYYMGRYEAGDSVSTTNKTLRASGASVTDKVAIKKGQAPYNYVTRDQAKILAEGMKTAEGYKATTKLCSSYSWDTAINFMQNKVSNYATNSVQGNYYDTTFSYTDIVGTIQTKASSSCLLVPTGETTPINNIYDMGGNEFEWTTEICSISGYPCTHRGGDFGGGHLSYPAGYRNHDSTTPCYSTVGFRVNLYM